MSKCTSCGKLFSGKIYPDGQCQGCYNYFHKGGKIYPLPDKGRVEKSEDGKIICHICGRAYSRLGSHIRESHDMTIKEYKEMFDLCNNCKTTEISYHEMMSDYANKYQMGERLKKTGFNTRVKPGETKLRKGKPVRLQERIDKSKRRLNKEKIKNDR